MRVLLPYLTPIYDPLRFRYDIMKLGTDVLFF